MKVYHLMLAIALILGCWALIGCGGSEALTTNQFAGNWTGTWTNTAESQSGTMTIAILSEGSFSGQIVNQTLNVTNVIRGVITDTGQLVGSMVISGTGAPLSGSVILHANGHITGNITETNSGTAHIMAVDLQK